MLCSNEVKNRGVERAQVRTHLTIFYIFPSNIQYIYWIGAEKIELDFFVCACADYNIIIFPGKYLHIYNRVARRKRIWWLCWFVAAQIDHGHILPRANINSAQIGTDGATWLWCNLRSQLVCRISYRQVISRQPHIILQWKNVWMYINLPCKNVMM